MNHHHHSTLSTEEQDRRHPAMRRALAQVRLAGLEPDPAVFEYLSATVTVQDGVALPGRLAA